MDKINSAIKCFNEENYDEAEKLSLELFAENENSIDAIDILAAIYLRTNNLNFLKSVSKKDLNLIRKIAVFLGDLKTLEQAAFFYRKALELEPNDIVGLNNIGLIYEELDDIEDARKVYEKSIKINPNYPALYNLGVLCRKTKELDKSIQLLTMAYKMKPDDKYANYSLGMSYLMEKNFSKGYPYFLKRPVQGIENLKNFWTGEPHLNKEILVYCEYGLGDAIMFARYFPFLKQYFEKVKVFCASSLKKLFKESFENIEFIESLENKNYDYCVLAMNLPYYLKMDFDNIPYTEGYLKIDEDKFRWYKSNYFDNELLKVGISYIGGELEKRNARYRSVELRKLSKLFELQNIKFYSFQKEDPFKQLKNFPHIVDLGSTFNNFSDTAAAMKNLDIMITIDSAPVHLAGALGVKTLLMLPYYSEWRWFTEENSTIWYDSVKIIKQPAPADWQSVVDKIYQILS